MLTTKKPVPKSLSTRQHADAMRAIVKRMDDGAVWDAIEAKDIPHELSEHVINQIEAGCEPAMVRRQLGIKRPNDKRWKKIVASIRQGIKVDVYSMYSRWVKQNEDLSNKMSKLLEETLEKAVGIGPEAIKDGDNQVFSGRVGKEFAQMVDAMNKLRQGTVRTGKDLGLFDDSSGGGNAAGVTIVVKSNVPTPSQKDIDAHYERQIIEVDSKDASSS